MAQLFTKYEKSRNTISIFIHVRLQFPIHFTYTLFYSIILYTRVCNVVALSSIISDGVYLLGLYIRVYVCMCEPNYIFNRWRWRWHIIFDIMAVLCFYFINGWINTRHGSITCGTIFCFIIRLLRLHNLPALLFGCFNDIWFTNEIKSKIMSSDSNCNKSIRLRVLHIQLFHFIVWKMSAHWFLNDANIIFWNNVIELQF